MDPVDVLNHLIGREEDPTLNAHERKACLLNCFETECANGGWRQYFWNSSGNWAEELGTYLPEFGYERTSEAFGLLRTAIGGAIPADREERIRRLEEVSEDVEERIAALVSEELDGMFGDICRYISDNAEHFAKG